MSGKRTAAVLSLLKYPYTWILLTVILAANIMFLAWFPVTLLYSLLLAGVDGFTLVLWFIAAFKSQSFRTVFNEMSDKKQDRELRKILNAMPDIFRFKEPAFACLSLLEKINDEFDETAYNDELALLKSNIYHLSLSHRKLIDRYRSFGTRGQKEEMKKYLDQQVGSLNNILESLKAFSGNLTLLTANAEKATEAANQLKYINEGFKEILKEEQ
ncbi:MAG: hypothetical protein JW969_09535 [Spirochaetales bacterium]|nr:hypothetical protein [Spirochaetales bacterium]